MVENKTCPRYILNMKKIFIFLAVSVITVVPALTPLFAQADTNRVAAGAEAQLAVLLNQPAMVKQALATPLGKNWFTLETDTHVFTDEASVAQVRAIMLDFENQSKYFNGKKSKMNTSVISRGPEETLVDYISVTIVPVVKIELKTPYRAVSKTLTDTDTKFAMDVRQLPHDSESNKKVKNLVAFRYVEEVNIGGKKYTYVRIYSIMDVDASILPGAKGTLEKNSDPANEEALSLIIAAAKTK